MGPAIDRTCVRCGKAFRGHQQRCMVCLATERICDQCGKNFTGTHRRCQGCRRTERACESCGRIFKGTALHCGTCQRTERACESCGKSFTGGTLRCPTCRATERACESCGKAFTGTALRCGTCWWESLPPEVRRARLASYNHARRARKIGAEVAGPVPPEVYEAIRTSGPCAYCTAPPTTVDHVRPLARGGWEHESNLVPACATCNFSKNDRLLTEWGRADRVAYGVRHSSKVAAEYERLTSEAEFAETVGALSPSR